MQDGLTKDGKKLFYEKDEAGSVIGQYVLYNIYDENNQLLGQRIGVRDLSVFNYDELFENGALIRDMREQYKARKPEKVAKPSKVKEQKTEPASAPSNTPGDVPIVNPESNPESEPEETGKKKKVKTSESWGVEDGYIESFITVKVHLKGKRKVHVSDIIELLKTKWEITGYSIRMEKDQGTGPTEENTEPVVPETKEGEE